ncbi:CIC11C00000000907 [Sungouiella intermedia]|uniref:Probable methionine--tRNA ligase, mitochondrial n=1 Tax=Sungouiella intermedia TaxID=45354 RepID=A0A1L0BFT7_9ASCO|nr:CIC11C00000000907 [[Candida] intermedia]
MKPPVLLAFKRCLSQKPFYVTTPIFYVNAKPHLGHLYSMLLADTRNRWELLKPGAKTFFLTGTDEHGLKIQTVAEKEGIEPKVLVDRVSQNFVELATKFNVRYDRFMRTTDEDHLRAVKHFWNVAMEKGLLYKGAHRGWYSVSDEAFYPETQIQDVLDPKTGKAKKVSIETNNEVVYHEEENYFFKLSVFQDKLIEFLEANPQFVIPSKKHSEVMAELRLEPLSDLSVSRPSSRLKWGIEVPNDDSQKIYVWFDALINYITAGGYPHKSTEDMIWPATHVVGKDIMRFHCIYWPIFLMACDLELPTQVIVHSHWLSEGVKMSKSLGNVVDPMNLADVYDVEPLRFYLMEQSNLGVDCKFSEGALQNHRSVVINKWANLISRIGGDKFNVAQSVQDFHQGKFAQFDHDYPVEEAEIRDKLVASVNSLHADMNAQMVDFGHMKALQRWWETVELANVFFQESQPWAYKKKIDAAGPNEAEVLALKRSYIIFLTAEASRIASTCLLPFMPNTAGAFLDRLGVGAEFRNSGCASVGAVQNYGEGTNSGKPKPLMRKLDL